MKSDLCVGEAPAGAIPASSVAADGLRLLVDSLEKHLAVSLGRDLSTLPTRQRHLDNLHFSVEELRRAFGDDYLALELRAESLRLAAFSLGRITGQHGVEDILGVIFSQFCVGK